jgi:hypothetical protein
MDTDVRVAHGIAREGKAAASEKDQARGAIGGVSDPARLWKMFGP